MFFPNTERLRLQQVDLQKVLEYIIELWKVFNWGTPVLVFG